MWGDGWLMGPFDHWSQQPGDGDLPPPHRSRHESVDGVPRAKAPTAEEEVSPVLAVSASDKPNGQLSIPYQPPEGEREAGGDGDGDGPIVFNDHGIRVPGTR